MITKDQIGSIIKKYEQIISTYNSGKDLAYKTLEYHKKKLYGEATDEQNLYKEPYENSNFSSEIMLKIIEDKLKKDIIDKLEISNKRNLFIFENYYDDTQDLLGAHSLQSEFDCKDGKDGKDGNNGNDGAPGLQGEKGDNGNNGNDGKDGAPGLQGEKGYQGEKGDNGKDGAPGLQGEKGDNGNDGAPGLQGEKGYQGEKGDNGKDGAPGLQGEKGDNGNDGAPGLQGINGKNGESSINWIGEIDEKNFKEITYTKNNAFYLNPHSYIINNNTNLSSYKFSNFNDFENLIGKELQNKNISRLAAGISIVGGNYSNISKYYLSRLIDIFLIIFLIITIIIIFYFIYIIYKIKTNGMDTTRYSF